MADALFSEPRLAELYDPLGQTAAGGCHVPPEAAGRVPLAATVSGKVTDQAPGLPSESMARTRQKRLPTGSVLVLT